MATTAGSQHDDEAAVPKKVRFGSQTEFCLGESRLSGHGQETVNVATAPTTHHNDHHRRHLADEAVPIIITNRIIMRVPISNTATTQQRVVAVDTIIRVALPLAHHHRNDHPHGFHSHHSYLALQLLLAFMILMTMGRYPPDGVKIV